MNELRPIIDRYKLMLDMFPDSDAVAVNKADLIAMIQMLEDWMPPAKN